MISHIEMISRIVVGAALGGVIGFERDLHGRQAGLRTHLIVSMASATFMVVSSQFIFFQNYDPSRHAEVDVSRIAASVVSGIGFLAGGSILKTGATIQGLTTAAGLWLVAAIGLCAGSGMYIEGLTATTIGLIALTLFRRFENKNDKLMLRYVSIIMEDMPDKITGIMEILTSAGVKVPDFDYERKTDSKTIGLTFNARIPLSLGVNGLIALLEKQVGIHHVHIRLRD